MTGYGVYECVCRMMRQCMENDALGFCLWLVNYAVVRGCVRTSIKIRNENVWFAWYRGTHRGKRIKKGPV